MNCNPANDYYSNLFLFLKYKISDNFCFTKMTIFIIINEILQLQRWTAKSIQYSTAEEKYAKATLRASRPLGFRVKDARHRAHEGQHPQSVPRFTSITSNLGTRPWLAPATSHIMEQIITKRAYGMKPRGTRTRKCHHLEACSAAFTLEFLLAKA